MLWITFRHAVVLWHEQRADGVFAGLGELEADLGRLALEERMRDLHQDAGAVAEARIGADGAAVLEIAEDAQRVGDDLMRLLALDVGDEADAAGILLQRRIVQAFGFRAPSVNSGVCNSGAMSAGFESALADSISATICSRSNSDPLISNLPGEGLVIVLRRTLGVPRAPQKFTGGHRSSKSEPYFQSSGSAFNVPGERLCLDTFAALGAELFVAIPMPVSQRNLRQ